MAIKTQAELEQASNATYTTNGANAITAATVRTFNTDFISSSIVAPMTSSMAVGSSISASYAATASLLLGTVVSASHANNADTASYVLNAVSASRATSAANATTASYVLNAVSASYAATASKVSVIYNNDNSTFGVPYVDFVSENPGLQLYTDSNGFKYSPQTNALSLVNLEGNVTGSLLGNASTATTASFAQTASSVNPLNQKIEITGSTNISGSIRLVNNGTNSLTITGSGGASLFADRRSYNVVAYNEPGLDVFSQLYSSDTATAGQYIGVYTPDTFVDDVEHAIIVSNTGVTLNDWDNGSAFDYVPYLTIAPNLGDNPTPQMKRGLSVTGSLAIQSGSGDLYVYGHKQFNGGMFQNNTTLSGSAGVSQSIALPVTDLSYGVSISNDSRITIANAGVYNLQFSAQCESSAGADTIYIWFKKNGTNVTDSATKVVMPNNTAQTMTVNIIVDAAANDYYELAWQNSNGFGKILSEAASGNIPLIPAVIVTVTQVR